MTTLQQRPTTVAVCENCETPAAARELDDGTLLLIGAGNRCPCGCDAFRPFPRAVRS